MDEFPFDEDDWFEVKEAAALVTNAVVYWDDLDLVTSAREQLFEKLAELAHKYGEQPVLIETQADFEDDDNQQVILYLRAIDLAELNHLPTLTSRLSLADTYNNLHDYQNACLQLQQCADDAKELGDGYDFEQWLEAARKCGLL